MRLLVCGDRNWSDYGSIVARIRELAPERVIEGEARGADRLARTAAYALGIGVAAFPAQWNTYGRSAGMIRNQQMLDEGKPDMVLAFHDNILSSKGTADMVRRAKQAGLPVEIWSHNR